MSSARSDWYQKTEWIDYPCSWNSTETNRIRHLNVATLSKFFSCIFHKVQIPITCNWCFHSIRSSRGSSCLWIHENFPAKLHRYCLLIRYFRCSSPLWFAIVVCKIVKHELDALFDITIANNHNVKGKTLAIYPISLEIGLNKEEWSERRLMQHLVENNDAGILKSC